MLHKGEKPNSLVLRKELDSPSEGSVGLGLDESPAAVVAGWSLALVQGPPNFCCSLLLLFES